MTTGIQDFSLTKDFSTDSGAIGNVNIADLQTQFQRVQDWLNLTLKDQLLDPNFRSDNTLADGLILLRQLSSEVYIPLASKIGWQPKADVATGSSANINIAAPGAIINGRTMVTNDRFLAKDQTLPAQNGIYVWNGAAVAATRSTDADTAAEIGYAFVTVSASSTSFLAGYSYVLTLAATDIVALGTTALSFSQVGSQFLPSLAMKPVVSALTLPLARAAMGPWDDVSVAYIDSVALLKNLAAPAGPSVYLLRGFYTAGDGGGGMFRWVAGDTATDDGGTILQLTAGGAGRWYRIYDGDLNALWFGAKGDGTTDDTAAFTKALAPNRPLFVPGNRVYVVGDLSIPARSVIYGRSVNGYTLVYSISTTFQRKAGCTRIFNVLDGMQLSDVTLNGVDRTCVGIGGVGSFGLMRNVYVGYCSKGIGDGGANYNFCTMVQCTVFGCTIGISNLRDSRVSACNIAACISHGIDLEAGANDNMITGCKIEFNGANGINLVGALDNTICGNIIDRSYINGIGMTSGSNNNTITGNMFRRNGGNDTGTFGQDSHIYINSCNYVTISGNMTRIGQEDNLTGPITPRYIYTLGGTNVNLTMVGNDFSGFTIANRNGSTTTTTPFVLRNNIGAANIEQGTLTNAFNAKQYLAYFPGVSVVASAVGAVIGVVTAPSVNTFSRDARRMLVYVRNTGTGATYCGEFNLAIIREGGSASISASGIVGEIGTAGSITIAGAGTAIRINFTSIATDGSSYAVSVDNASGVNQMNVTVEIT